MKKKFALIIIFGIAILIHPLAAQTWTSAKRLTWTPDGSYDPDITADTNENIHITWEELKSSAEIFYKKSTNGGVNWTTKRLTWDSGYSSSPAVATDSSNNIHVVWYKDFTSVAIFYKKSTNGGSSWTEKRLTWSGGSYYPDIATGGGNNIHVVWEGGHGGGDFEIFYKKSVDGGTSWTQKQLTWNTGSSGYPAIAINKSNHILIVWQDYSPGNYEIYFKRSTNGGTSWTTKRLTWGSGQSLRPAIATDKSNNIHVVWRDNATGDYEIYYKRSTNGGTSWTTKRLTWNSEYSFSQAIATDSSNNIHVAWVEERSGNRDIFYKRSTNGGISWSNRRLTWTAGETSSPSLATDASNNIHLVYYDNTTGTKEIYYKKGIQ
jgi:hypothetical protein